MRLALSPDVLLRTLWVHLTNSGSLMSILTAEPLAVDQRDKGWCAPWRKSLAKVALSPSGAGHYMCGANLYAIDLFNASGSKPLKTTCGQSVANLYRQFFQAPRDMPLPVSVSPADSWKTLVTHDSLPKNSLVLRTGPELCYAMILGLFMAPSVDTWDKQVRSVVVHIYSNDHTNSVSSSDSCLQGSMDLTVLGESSVLDALDMADLVRQTKTALEASKTSAKAITQNDLVSHYQKFQGKEMQKFGKKRFIGCILKVSEHFCGDASIRSACVRLKVRHGLSDNLVLDPFKLEVFVQVLGAPQFKGFTCEVLCMVDYMLHRGSIDGGMKSLAATALAGKDKKGAVRRTWVWCNSCYAGAY